MTQTLATVVVFVLLLACLPALLKWLKTRAAGGLAGMGVDSKVISAVAVGPHQRVVTVEVGPSDARVWLVLGVTPQAISCLHSMPPRAAAVRGGMASSDVPALVP